MLTQFFLIESDYENVCRMGSAALHLTPLEILSVSIFTFFVKTIVFAHVKLLVLVCLSLK